MRRVVMWKRHVSIALGIQVLMIAQGYPAGGLVEAYRTKRALEALSVAYEFKALQPLSMYGEIVQWLDTELLEKHGNTTLVELIFNTYPAGDDSSLKIFVGLFYFLAEHSRSTVLKRQCLQLLSQPAAVMESLYRPLAAAIYVTETAVRVTSTPVRKGFWAWLRRRNPFGRRGAFEEELSPRLDTYERHERMLGAVLALYGDYFEYALVKRADAVSLCGVILRTTARLGESVYPPAEAASSPPARALGDRENRGREVDKNRKE